MSSEQVLIFPTPQCNSKFPSSPSQGPRYLPIPTRSSNKFTLVLDLDETLVHSSATPILNPDQIVQISSSAGVKTFYVKYRPGMSDFLKKVSSHFDLVLYTASTQQYAEQVINKIDPNRKLLKHRLYRHDCVLNSGFYIKDLGRLGRDLSQVIIVDDSITSFAYHLNNGVPIQRWTGDINDNELEKAYSLLFRLLQMQDVRPVLCSIFNLPKLIEDYKVQTNANQSN